MSNTSSTSSTKAPAKAKGRGAAATLGLVVGAALTILLVIFIVQNSDSVTPNFLNLTMPTLALGVYLLIAAAVGFLVSLLLVGTRKVSKKI